MRPALTVGLLALVLPVAVALGSAGSRAYVPVLRGESGALAYKPGRMVVSGAQVLTRIRYQTYGGAASTARATLLVDDCRPDCADGASHPVAARLTFAGSVRCRGKHVYSTVRIEAPGAARYGMLTNRIVALDYLAAVCEPGQR
jgi:hypothetical protein